MLVLRQLCCSVPGERGHNPSAPVDEPGSPGGKESPGNFICLNSIFIISSDKNYRGFNLNSVEYRKSRTVRQVDIHQDQVRQLVVF